MSRAALYVWFLLSNIAFPRHAVGIAEDLGIFFGSLWGMA